MKGFSEFPTKHFRRLESSSESEELSFQMYEKERNGREEPHGLKSLPRQSYGTHNNNKAVASNKRKPGFGARNPAEERETARQRTLPPLPNHPQATSSAPAPDIDKLLCYIDYLQLQRKEAELTMAKWKSKCTSLETELAAMHMQMGQVISLAADIAPQLLEVLKFQLTGSLATPNRTSFPFGQTGKDQSRGNQSMPSNPPTNFEATNPSLPPSSQRQRPLNPLIPDQRENSGRLGMPSWLIPKRSSPEFPGPKSEFSGSKSDLYQPRLDSIQPRLDTRGQPLHENRSQPNLQNLQSSSFSFQREPSPGSRFQENRFQERVPSESIRHFEGLKENLAGSKLQGPPFFGSSEFQPQEIKPQPVNLIRPIARSAEPSAFRAVGRSEKSAKQSPDPVSRFDERKPHLANAATAIFELAKNQAVTARKW